MDILTHTVSGAAVGAAIAIFAKGGVKTKTAILFGGLIGGFLPDTDAISLWSGFDATFGKFFSLNMSGKEIYSAKLWYSHHGFMHSIAAGALFSLVIYFFIFLGRKFWNFSKSLFLAPLSFFIGFMVHLLEDTVTPGSTWGGVRLFYPADKYVGGFGNIWWWNNYDIFLIVSIVFVLNIIFLILGRYIKSIFIKILPIIFCVIGGILVCIQINSRDFDFSYSGHTKKYNEYEAKSKEIQKDILGDRFYSVMQKLDSKLKFYF